MVSSAEQLTGLSDVVIVTGAVEYGELSLDHWKARALAAEKKS